MQLLSHSLLIAAHAAEPAFSANQPASAAIAMHCNHTESHRLHLHLDLLHFQAALLSCLVAGSCSSKTSLVYLRTHTLSHQLLRSVLTTCTYRTYACLSFLQGGVSKPAAAGGGKAAAGGGIPAGGVGVGLEEEIKKLQRAQKFGKLSDADEKKLQGLQRKLEAQKQKQQLALDKVCGHSNCKMCELWPRGKGFCGWGEHLYVAVTPRDQVWSRSTAATFFLAAHYRIS